MSEYVFEHEGKTYAPSGKVQLESSASEHNQELERQEIAWLKTAPEKVFLYVHMPPATWHIEANTYVGHIEGNTFASKDAAQTQLAQWLESKRLPRYDSRGWKVEYKFTRNQQLTGSEVRTWLGTSVATNVHVGTKANSGFNGAYRRAISCKIFGVQYHGWYYESSGDYCRLKKAKKQ